jgi:hypothetical protein
MPYQVSENKNVVKPTNVQNSIGREIGVDPEVILATSHGRRSIDVLKEYDSAKANMDCKHR